MTRRATIRDVAEAAGVSVGTVSNVLTGQRPVRAATRAAVEDAIAKLGYVPDVTAQALIGRRGRAVPAVPNDAPRLLSVGYVCSDDIAQVERTPHGGERMLAQAISRKLGGRAANVAVTAAGLGAPLDLAVEVLSVLGNDAESDWATATLASRRVALAPESRVPDASLSRAVILLQADGLRTILNEPLQVSVPAFRAAASRALALTTRFAIFVQGEQVAGLADAIAAMPSRAQLVTQVNGAVAADDPGAWRRYVGLFGLTILNAEAAEVLYGQARDDADMLARVAAGAGALCPIVVLTLGSGGAVLFLNGDLTCRLPAPAVTILDETGAGDAFAGAFLSGWLHGLPPATAVHMGVEAGSRAVTLLGAQEHGIRAQDLIQEVVPPQADAAARVWYCDAEPAALQPRTA
ncbi:MAG: hypothetical protein CML66_04055 [Rhodobacteraceae bacterium]|nr:hypothetical protein [Paracoccaceae bacterium]MAY43682.1 hypothetical protein [Paracoccaceae bacterium]QEW22499.1 Ribokinase [Marinibacterium anthonyi]